MLKQRVITALAMASVIIGSILLADHRWVVGLFAVVLFAASYELILLTIKPGLAIAVVIATMVACLFWVSSGTSGIRVNFYQSYTGILLWVAIFGFLMRYRYSGHWSLPVRIFHLLLGISLLWICVHGLVFVHLHFKLGGWILLYLLSLVWVADIGAYFSGRKFGKHKLAPGISPSKTWEGVAGGIILNIGWILFVFLISSGWDIAIWQFLLIGLVTSIISVVGDLYESILKREASVKDSSKLLPGHGGVLDRIDSVIAATPVFVIGLYVVGAV
ncbi:MAG: phosphatidate cytidylyltransferase [Gammaproteobacteria bacterium]|nr:phosphatidate cytidylyltransferase [Gammaproteobacteria bacterium]